MKYLCIVMLLASCSQTPKTGTKPATHEVEGSAIPLQEVVVDGCQYLYGPWGNATVFTHKGNCHNPIHPEHLIKPNL